MCIHLHVSQKISTTSCDFLAWVRKLVKFDNSSDVSQAVRQLSRSFSSKHVILDWETRGFPWAKSWTYFSFTHLLGKMDQQGRFYSSSAISMNAFGINTETWEDLTAGLVR